MKSVPKRVFKRLCVLESKLLLGLEESVVNKPPCLLSFTRGKAIEYMIGGESWISVNDK